jgi:hypothetical protein
MLTFKQFLQENPDSVLLSLKKIRDQISVIKLSRELEREKEKLASLKKKKRGAGINRAS